MKEFVHPPKLKIEPGGRMPEPWRGIDPESRSAAKRQDRLDNVPSNEVSKGKESDNNSRPDSQKQEVNEPIRNKQDGLRREEQVENELRKQYPEKDGYEILREVYLRDKDGKIVKDPITGEARRVDFVVVKDGKVVRMIEVTSPTADKTGQNGKEQRIRAAGGNYIRENNGQILKIDDNTRTEIVRKD